MPERPNCLNRRCKVLDELVEDINSNGPNGSRCGTPVTEKSSSENNEVGIKLMCDFWKILQEDPECNLPQEVQQRMCVENCTGRCRRDQDARESKTSTCSKIIRVHSPKNEPRRGRPVPKKHNCGATSDDTVPLHKALGNLKEAASFEKKCNEKVGELASAQKELAGQIRVLECKEKKGVELLKQADCMWSCMEDAYKKKLAASQERVQFLQNNLKQIETSGNKWRKTKKDLEFSLKNATQANETITQRLKEKNNDIRVMTLEIEDYKKRIESNAKEFEAVKNSYKSKKEASDARLAKIAGLMAEYQNKVVTECKCKTDKEQEGGEYVKDARDDLQKLCRCLLQKKLENEDLRAEKEALLLEIGLLKTTCETCAERCAKREKNIADETKKMDEEIEGYISKCVQCHRATDSSDIKNFCADCPRCLQERECLVKGDHCDPDQTQECVCTRIKEKFLDNVFDNMYTVLEKESKTCPGRELADCVMNCLKRSRNGKLDENTRKMLQEFILSTVKKNLNLTIVGGAVKTRCEMEPATYNQLMLCLKDVTIVPPPKADKAVSRKPPCNRWSEISECYCPGGPGVCPCCKRAPPPPPAGPTPCGETQKTGEDPSVKICPKRESLACGTDCGMTGLPGAMSLRREPCEGKSCPFGNMRAAQCSLGPEALPCARTVGQCGKLGCSCNTCYKTPSTPSDMPSKVSRERTHSRCSTRGKHSGCDCFILESAYDRKVSRSSRGEVLPALSGDRGRRSRNTSDAKHPKAKIKDKKGTRANYKKITKEKRPTTCLPLSDAAPKHYNILNAASHQKAILLGDQLQKTIFEESNKHNLNQPDITEQFKLAVDNGQSNCQFTELTQTGSGNLAIELDDHTIKIIEEKTTTDPYLAMSIKTTTSGHVLVDLDRKNNIIDKTHRVTVRRTSSGTTLLDIHKNMIKILKDTILSERLNCGLSKSIKLPLNPQRPENQIEVQTSNQFSIDFEKIDNRKNETGNSSSQLQYTKTKNKNEKKVKNTSSKTTLDSNGCILISQDTTSSKYIDPVLQLKNATASTNADNYLKDILGPIITELYKPLTYDTKEELKFTCSKTTTNTDYCKLMNRTDLNIKDPKEYTVADTLLKNEEPSCSGAKTNTSSINCKPATKVDSPQKWLTTSSWKTISTNESVNNYNYTSEFEKSFKQDTINVTVEIKVDNVAVRKLPSVVKRTKSGTIAIYDEGMSSIKEISCDGREYPAFLSKTVSGTYLVSIDNNQNVNMILKKTPSEGILLMARKPKDHEVKDFFKVKLYIMRNQTLELPAVLKSTSSNNYILVLDKEFERHYKASINKYFEDKLEGSVDLHTTSSGNFVIELNNEDKPHGVKKNALLVKSLSGNIKVLVQRPEFESMAQLKSTSSSSSLAQELEQINSNLPTTSREYHKEKLEKSKTLSSSKIDSDTQLLEKVKVTLQDTSGFNVKSCAVLKKTASGLYAVVLNKESKEAFLEKLHSTSTTNSKVLVPIKQLDSGVFIIDLNNKDVENGLCGSLKITPSGNMYVVIEEDVIKDSESSTMIKKLSSTRFKHVTQLIDSVTRANTTRSHARLDDCCCNAPTCDCEELQFDTVDGSNDRLTKRASPCGWKEANANNCNTENLGSASEPGTSMQGSSLNISTSDLTPRKFNSKEQCYYLLSSSHLFSSDDSMSCKFEISELNKPHKTRDIKNKTFANTEPCARQNIRPIQDSFLYDFPPQLPAFLKDGFIGTFRH